MATRREKLEAMLQNDPSDAFLQYGLAVELAASGEFDSALQGFGRLMVPEKQYVPAFFRAGQLLCELDRVIEAREVLRAGIEAARCQGDSHAAGEMSELLIRLGEFS
jgi:predicted Zn-dependent protease